jgi:hypothetical protein
MTRLSRQFLPLSFKIQLLETFPQKTKGPTKTAAVVLPVYCMLPRQFGTQIILVFPQTICKNAEIVHMQALQKKHYNITF